MQAGTSESLGANCLRPFDSTAIPVFVKYLLENYQVRTKIGIYYSLTSRGGLERLLYT